MLGEVDTCEPGDRGAPAVQWALPRSGGGGPRAVQVGLLSRGLGCPTSGRSRRRSRPAAIYTKLARRRAWIMAHIAEGGCQYYY